MEWQDVIAKASRLGFHDQEELQWDSYIKLDEELKKEWLESVEKRKTSPKPKGSKRAPKSFEQRRKISEAISAKWNDEVCVHLHFKCLINAIIHCLQLFIPCRLIFVKFPGLPWPGLFSFG